MAKVTRQIKEAITEAMNHNVEMQKDNMELLTMHFESTFRKDNPDAPEYAVKKALKYIRQLMETEVRKNVLSYLERNPDEVLDKLEEDDGE